MPFCYLAGLCGVAIELMSEYHGSEKSITCRCKKCGNTWETIPKVLTANGSGCPECGLSNSKLSRIKPQETFVRELEVVNPNIELIGTYIGTHKKTMFKCSIDGTIWHGYPANLLNNTAGCPTCNISAHERMMVQILHDLGINIAQQYSIKDCRLKHPLRFDAFDENRRIAFEYNGEQHYMPIDFAGKGDQWAKESLEITIKRDNAKKDYCIKNNIQMVIIPYWEKDNMKAFIINELSKIGVCMI